MKLIEEVNKAREEYYNNTDGGSFKELVAWRIYKQLIERLRMTTPVYEGDVLQKKIALDAFDVQYERELRFRALGRSDAMIGEP